MFNSISNCQVCNKRPYKYVRICSKCKKPIKQYHKWRINIKGRLEHKNCKKPESYFVSGKQGEWPHYILA